MMGFLADYVQRHFRHEEELMEKHRCPAKAKNQAAHREFLEEFARMSAAFENGQGSTSLLLELRKLVAAWLTGHICSIDTKLRGCASAHSQTSAASQEAAAADLNFKDC